MRRLECCLMMSRQQHNIKITLQNLQSGTKKLDEDLEALQHNFLLRGFFRKKARDEKADTTSNDTVNYNCYKSQNFPHLLLSRSEVTIR